MTEIETYDCTEEDKRDLAHAVSIALLTLGYSEPFVYDVVFKDLSESKLSVFATMRNIANNRRKEISNSMGKYESELINIVNGLKNRCNEAGNDLKSISVSVYLDTERSGAAVKVTIGIESVKLFE